MQIVALAPDYLNALDALYRRTTGNVPHCRFAPSPRSLMGALLDAAQAGTQIFVATSDGVPLGFVALRGRGRRAVGRRQAEVTALFTEDAQTGEMLLDAVTAYARDRGAERLLAFPADHFRGPILGYNAGWGGLSDRIGLVAHALARKGFTPFHRELHLEYVAGRYHAEPAPRPPGLTIARRANASGSTVLAACLADQEVGTCEFSRLDRISDHPRAARWGYIWGLEVAAAQRRRGLGRLLMRRALADLWEQGCTGCWLTTTATNWPAQALYLALGFAVVDASTSFRKDLRGG